MTLPTGALIEGVVARTLPTFNADSTNNGVAARMGSYGEQYSQPLVRKQHNLADEGTYYVANNAQTGIVPHYETAFDATKPFLTLFNNNVTARLYLDYINLLAMVPGIQTTAEGFTAAALLIDNVNQWSSGGTTIGAGKNANMASSAVSGVVIHCGAITGVGLSAVARTLVGIRNLRPSVSSTVINVAGDLNLLNFGSVEGNVGVIDIAKPCMMPQAMPPVVLGPGHSAMFYIWYEGITAPSAATYAPEIGFWVR
jgi:hypothetical protein